MDLFCLFLLWGILYWFIYIGKIRFFGFIKVLSFLLVRSVMHILKVVVEVWLLNWLLPSLSQDYPLFTIDSIWRICQGGRITLFYSLLSLASISSCWPLLPCRDILGLDSSYQKNSFQIITTISKDRYKSIPSNKPVRSVRYH